MSILRWEKNYFKKVEKRKYVFFSVGSPVTLFDVGDVYYPHVQHCRKFFSGLYCTHFTYFFAFKVLIHAQYIKIELDRRIWRKGLDQ